MNNRFPQPTASDPPTAPSAARLLSRIRLRHLSCFVAIAQERNLGRAAERLHLSQPAVSKTLSELEALAGARLVARGRQGAQLTPAGERFLRHAVEVTHALESAATALAGAGEPSASVVKVGALPTVSGVLLPTAIARLHEQRPHAGVQLSTAANTELLTALRTGELDFMLGRMSEPAMMQGVSFELLYAEPLAFVVRPGHPLLEQPGATISLQAVLDYPLVVATAGTVPRHHAETFFQKHGLRLPPGCTETLAVSVARLLACRSNAVWITPEGVAQDDLNEGWLVRLDVPTPGTEEPVGLLRRSAAESSEIAEELIRLLRESASTYVGGRRRES